MHKRKLHVYYIISLRVGVQNQQTWRKRAIPKIQGPSQQKAIVARIQAHKLCWYSFPRS